MHIGKDKRFMLCHQDTRLMILFLFSIHKQTRLYISKLSIIQNSNIHLLTSPLDQDQHTSSMYSTMISSVSNKDTRWKVEKLHVNYPFRNRMPSENMAAPADTFHSNEQHKANPFRLAQLPSYKQHAVFIVISIIFDHIGW